jgi:hypothetical protein
MAGHRCRRRPSRSFPLRLQPETTSRRMASGACKDTLTGLVHRRHCRSDFRELTRHSTREAVTDLNHGGGFFFCQGGFSCLSVRFDRLPVRSDVGAAAIAGPANELTLDVGKPDLVLPSIGAELDQKAATIVRAIDQQTANAGSAHSPNVIFSGRPAMPIEAR